MYILLLSLMCLIILIVALKFISSTISILAGSPSGESSKYLIKEIFSKIIIKKTDIIYDLGCGYGNVVVAISAHFQPKKIIGVEVSPLPFISSCLRVIGRKNIIIKYQNILKVNLHDANIVFCYLWPTLLERLVPKFKHELHHNSVIISPLFQIKGLKYSQIIQTKKMKVYVYNI